MWRWLETGRAAVWAQAVWAIGHCDIGARVEYFSRSSGPERCGYAEDMRSRVQSVLVVEIRAGHRRAHADDEKHCLKMAETYRGAKNICFT